MGIFGSAIVKVLHYHCSPSRDLGQDDLCKKISLRDASTRIAHSSIPVAAHD